MQNLKIETLFSEGIENSTCFPIGNNDQFAVVESRIAQFQMTFHQNCSQSHKLIQKSMICFSVVRNGSENDSSTIRMTRVLNDLCSASQPLNFERPIFNHHREYRFGFESQKYY
jgi:hypothetical protein